MIIEQTLVQHKKLQHKWLCYVMILCCFSLIFATTLFITHTHIHTQLFQSCNGIHEIEFRQKQTMSGLKAQKKTDLSLKLSVYTLVNVTEFVEENHLESL